MKLDIFLSKYNNAVVENKLLKFIIIVIGITVLINTGLLYSYIRTSRTVIVPPKINSQIEIYGNRASDAYYKEFARYICSLLFSYTPATARTQFSELLTLYSPNSYGKAKTAFYDLADQIEKSGLSSIYYIQKIEVSENSKEIYITGIRSIMGQAGASVRDSVEKYVISFYFDNGRFYLTDTPKKVEE